MACRYHFFRVFVESDMCALGKVRKLAFQFVGHLAPLMEIKLVEGSHLPAKFVDCPVEGKEDEEEESDVTSENTLENTVQETEDESVWNGISNPDVSTLAGGLSELSVTKDDLETTLEEEEEEEDEPKKENPLLERFLRARGLRPDSRY